MAKRTYKIPTDLSLSYLDQEISLSSNTQGKQLQLRLLLSWLASLFIGFWLVTQTFIGGSGPIVIVLFVVWWLGATVFYCRQDATRRMRLLGLFDLAGYLPPSARRVRVRRGSPAQPLLDIVGVRRVEASLRPGEPARVTFTDGRLGHVYQVVGSASVLLFESDRSAILDRVDAFYRKIDTTTEWIFLTLKRAQRVETQLDHVERWARRHSGDAQLSALLETRRSLLAGEVGDFLSIQQYLVLRSDNAEALHKAHALVITEAAESPLMLRTVEPLGCERALGVLAELFSGR